MDKKSKDRFEITELFMARADIDRCFTGIIKRFKDAEGNPVSLVALSCPMVFYVQAHLTSMSSEKIWMKMAIMILDKNLHSDAG